MPQVEFQGIRIHFEDSGPPGGAPAAPAIVLGHSFLCSGAMWAPQVPRLAERCRVVNLDYRGHGRSGPAESDFDFYDLVGETVAVLDALGIERAVWAGLSIGGMVGLRAALTVPERVAALVLLDTHAGPERRWKKIKYGAMGTMVRLFGVRPLVPAVLPLMFGATTLAGNRPLVEEWAERFAANHVPSMLAGVRTLVRRDSLLARLGEIEQPALVIVGEEDRSLPVAYSEEIHAALSGSRRLVVVPGAGHLSTLERPGEVTGAMLDFLGELEAGS